MSKAGMVRKFVADYPQCNHREIGKMIGCSHHYVRAVLARERLKRRMSGGYQQGYEDAMAQIRIRCRQLMFVQTAKPTEE